ncbi:MAG: Uncharacterized protein G01um10143_277 [Parcubacteria group bacterium Gr01-1014_3]|nr:MAG: Uncharacterized protein G01um10143_277 [Parcubacteria group bacterium Gr01-1014_3]
MLAKKYRLPVQIALKKRYRSLKSSYFSVKILPGDLEYSRFGVVISKKTAKKAVDRNRLKRIVYDLVGTKKDDISVGDYIISILPPAASLSKEALKTELLKLLT